MSHDLDLVVHVVDVVPGDEPALGDGLVGVVDPRGELGEEVGVVLNSPCRPARPSCRARRGRPDPQVRQHASLVVSHGGGGGVTSTRGLPWWLLTAEHIEVAKVRGGVVAHRPQVRRRASRSQVGRLDVTTKFLF